MSGRLEKNTYVSGSAEGTVRTSTFSSWQNYQVLSYTDFEQATTQHAGPPYVFGGPWYMRRRWDKRTSISASTTLCKGTLVLGNRSTPYTGLLQYTPLTVSEESHIGSTLWNHALPTKPVVDLPVALGEIKRDGLPAVPLHEWKEMTRSARETARRTGSENLNIQFGWKPLVSDMKKFAKAVMDGHKIIDGYRKGANSDQRRYRELPAKMETKSEVGTFVVLPSQANVFASGSSKETISQKVWFVGHFKYHLPMGDDLISRMSRYHSYARKLFGIRATPDVVWNLAPWSWAADWFGDFGLVIENLSNLGLDGLYGHDCYLMHHTRSEMEFFGTVNSKNISGTLYRTYGEEFKYRRRASPFGFDFADWNSVSPFQASIAMSLGLSLGSRGSYTAR
jgi:hypothetical protein